MPAIPDPAITHAQATHAQATHAAEGTWADAGEDVVPFPAWRQGQYAEFRITPDAQEKAAADTDWADEL